MTRLNILNKTLGWHVAVILFVAGVSPTSFAHSGRLNSQGCHAGSQPYHCHRSSSEMTSSSSGGSRLRCSAGSQSTDCNSQPGTARASSSSTSLALTPHRRLTREAANTAKTPEYRLWMLTLALKEHCTGIPDNFHGTESNRETVKEIVKVFQATHDLAVDGIAGTNTLARLERQSTGLCKVTLSDN